MGHQFEGSQPWTLPKEHKEAQSHGMQAPPFDIRSRSAVSVHAYLG